MGYTNGLWEGMFGNGFGAWYRADKICFKTVAEGADTCTLLLFGKGKEEPKKEVPMTRIGNSAVFYTEVSEKDAKGCMTYLFAGENGRFTDVYAKAVCGKEVFGTLSDEVRPILPEKQDWKVSKVHEADFLCPGFSELIFYKLHVRGFTKHASSGVKNKGTYAGMIEKIPYLKELGINAVLLMPVYEFDECMEVSQNCGCLTKKQLAQYEARYGEEFVKVQKSYETGKETKSVERVNYWGYANNNLYFAPKASYAADKKHPEEELCSLAEALHEAGIAVFYEFYFGPEVKKSLITDCLRYWTYRYGADGFRLIGDNGALPLLLEDPYLSGVKFMVTDAGSLGTVGAQTFEERRVAVYNDGFRNVMRRFVKGDENMVGEFVGRLCGEQKEFAQIQYVADQNGFSVYDLFAYDRKHNEENGEDNKDGEDYNYSWNCGIEGETPKKKINALRARLRKNALSTVLLSRSVPMLFMGDEFGHTKQGNNNAYCQDNEISWLNWRLNKERQEQLSFVKDLIAFRSGRDILSGGRALRGSDWKNVGLPDVSYHGVQLWQPDYAPYSRTVSVLFNGAYGEGLQDDIYLLFNMHWEELRFALPTESREGKVICGWKTVLDTSGECEILSVNEGKTVAVTADESLTEYFCKVPARTVVALERKRD